MRQNIILLFISIQCISTSWTQDSLSYQLMLLEKDIYGTSSDTFRTKLTLKKVGLYLEQHTISPDLLREIKRIDYTFLDTTTQRAFLWNASLISYLLEDTYYALYYLDRYETHYNDSTIEKDLLKFLIHANYNTDAAKEQLQQLHTTDSTFATLSCILDLQEATVPFRKFKKTIAYFLPGFGLIFNGNIGKGSTSLLLNSATVVSIVWLLQQNMIVNTIAWGSNLVFKFYLGNINLTASTLEQSEKKILKRLASKCEPYVSSILKKYPLELRTIPE